MNRIDTQGLGDFEWPGDSESVTEVPGRVFYDPAIYQREQEKIFRGDVWNFVGLEVEIPNQGDYKTVYIGDTPLVLVRGENEQIHCWINRCAHRNANIVLDNYGNSDGFYCVYHQWGYGLDGALESVPFKRGLGGKGGMSECFDQSKVRPLALRVETFHGVVFASFSEQVEPLEEYLGPTVSKFMARIFNRPIKILGRQHQHMKGNWKLYAENPRDGYHASLLHIFFATFGLFRASQEGRIHVENGGKQTCFYTFVGKEDEQAKKQGMTEAAHTYQEGKFTLEDMSLLAGKMEWDDGINLVIIDVFPIMMLQQIANVLNIRQFQPHGPDGVTVHYTFFGYEDDDAETEAMRLKQINLIGPAGLVSMEDGLAIEIAQNGIAQDQDASAVIKMGGTGVDAEGDFLGDEGPVRGFWNAYTEMMELR